MVLISECQKLLKSILAHTTNGNGWNHGEHVLFFSVASPHLRILNRPVKMFKKLFCLLAVFATASAFVAPASNGVGEFPSMLLEWRRN